MLFAIGIIIAVISIAQYHLTDKGGHTAIYKTNKNVHIKN